MMKRLALLFVVLPSLAFGQSSPNWPQGYRPSTQEMNTEWASKRDYAPNPVPSPGTAILYAIDYGVIPDGVTSNDLQLKNAVDACAAIGTALYLPPGRILLTGAATINMRSCALVGAGVQAGSALTGSSLGTTLLLTGTTAKPFNICSNWSITGVNFYWPNQTTGTLITYPPLFNDAPGCAVTGNWAIRNSNIINAYDVYTQTTAGSGDFWVTDSTLYAVHRVFKMGNVGDTVHMSGLLFSPGPWLGVCGSGCNGAINAGALQNAIVEATSGTFSAHMVNSHAFAWRYWFLIDANAVVSQSVFDIGGDGIGTIIDASASNALWAGNTVVLNGVVNCGSVPAYPSALGVTVNPCFNMGNGSTLRLTGFEAAQVNGDFIVTSGGQVYLDHVIASGMGTGGIGGTTDYYGIYFTGAVGGSILSVKNSSFSSVPSDTHVHGIVVGSGALARLTIEGNDFSYFNDVLTVASAPTTIITNNWSVVTAGSYSIQVSGTNGVIYTNNNWDKPPTAAISACGTGAAIAGAFSGVAFVGSTNPTTTCVITLPWIPYGVNAGLCVFGGTNGTPAINANFTLTPLPQWTVFAASDMHGDQLTFHCPGQQ